jgi:hypothetical protein
METVPVQVSRILPRREARVRKVVHMRAYEVYERICGEQKALIEGWCRGGFGVNELIAFLYARTFPQGEWRDRFDEALADMENL